MTMAREQNMFFTGALPLLFLKTATPIILVMTINGLFALVDAWFLGEFVGDDALFPRLRLGRCAVRKQPEGQ